MSAILYGNCETCGLAYTVEEFDHNYVVEVEGRGVRSAELPSPSMTLRLGERSRRKAMNRSHPPIFGKFGL